MRREPNIGERVCSRVPGKYCNVPGTVTSRAQWQTDSDAIRYIVALDNGQSEVFMARELEELTPEKQKWYEDKCRRDEEWNRKQEEKRARKAENIRRQREEQANRGNIRAAKRAAEQEAKRQANNEEQRRAHAAEYGRQSLTRGR